MCRLFTLIPTQQEVKDLIDHVDSPYIRAVSSHSIKSMYLIGFQCILSSRCEWPWMMSQLPIVAPSGGLSLPPLCGEPSHAVELDTAICEGP